MIGRKKPYDHKEDESERVSHHFELSLLDWERRRLIDLLEVDRKPTIQERRWLAGRLKDAIRRSGPPLPHATIDWETANSRAAARGGDVIDLFFDEAHAKEPPA